VLFDCTIAESIACGANSWKALHEITSAAKAADIRSFVESLPKVIRPSFLTCNWEGGGGQE